MIYSLRFRLLVLMLAVLIAATGGVGALASRFTTRHFYSYIQYDDTTRMDRFVDLLATYYTYQGNWEEVQPLINQMSEISGSRIALVDNQGQVIAASDHTLLDQNLSLAENDSDSVEIRVRVMSRAMTPEMGEDGFLSTTIPATRWQNKAVGAVYVEQPTKEQVGFIHSVNQSVAVVAALAGVAAILIILFLSRHLFRPLEELTFAARALEKGDLTRRVKVRSQDEVGELSQAFNAMAEALIRVEKLRRSMVSDIAHEFRTPLSNLRGYLEAFQDGIAKPTPEMIDMLLEETLLLARLLDDLQDLALAEARQMRLHIRAVDMGHLLERSENALKAEAEAKHLHIAIDVPPDLPLVYADPERVIQVVRNLLKNAIIHTSEHGTIRLMARHTAEGIEVQVQDNGCGIPPQHFANIFERFYRLDESRNRHTGGVGLGLAIVKQLVELHQGRVWVESSPGQGANFGFTLPVTA